jgi:hypothetical protein
MDQEYKVYHKEGKFPSGFTIGLTEIDGRFTPYFLRYDTESSKWRLVSAEDGSELVMSRKRNWIACLSEIFRYGGIVVSSPSRGGLFYLLMHLDEIAPKLFEEARHEKRLEFTADMARTNCSDNKNKSSFDMIIEQIKFASGIGKDSIEIDCDITQSDIDDLRAMGYKIKCDYFGCPSLVCW